MAFSSLLRCRQGVSASAAPHWSLLSLFSDQVFTPHWSPWSLERDGDWRAATRWRPRLTSGCLSLSQIPFIILSLWCHWHYKPPRPDGAVHVLSAFHSRILRRRAEVWMLSGLVSERVMMAALCWILIQTGGHSTVSLPSLSGETQQNMRQFSSSLLT